MTPGYLVTCVAILTGYFVVNTTALEQPCDLNLANQCNCTYNADRSVYDISCKGNVTEHLIMNNNVTQPIRINLLDLSFNQISASALPMDFLDGISNISTLDLRYNSLSEIPSAVAKSGLTIGELRLGHNEITIFNVSSLSILQEIRTIDLSYNNLTQIVGNTGSSTTWNIGQLDLSFNNLTKLQSTEFTLLRNVHSLDLTHNNIQKITDVFPVMSIRNLNLSYNAISNLPDGIFRQLSQLQELVMSNNKFTHVKSLWFTGLANLRFLNLYNNNITHLETQFLQHLPNLHTLDLSYNNIAALGATTFAGRISRLKTLNLSHNKLVNLDKYSLMTLNHLTTLRMAGNHKLSISYNTYLPQHLVVLDLTDCSIAELFACDFNSLVDLKFLHLQGNNLSCDCHMTWLIKWYQTSMDPELRLHTDEKQPWVCKTSSSLIPFNKYPRDSFICEDVTHANLYCESANTDEKSDFLIGSNDTVIHLPEDVDLRMNTTADGETITSEWSANNAYPIYGFKVEFSGSEEGVIMSPWIHSSQRKYIMTDIVSYTNYNVCVSAYHNETVVIGTACQSVYAVSYKVYIGIMAGMVAIVPCFFVLLIVIWKDKRAIKYEQLLYVEDPPEETKKKEAGLERSISQPVGVSKHGNPLHPGDTPPGKSTGGHLKEVESYTNQSFTLSDEQSRTNSLDKAQQRSNSKDGRITGSCNSADSASRPSVSLDAGLQCCDDDKCDKNFSTRL